MLWQFSTFQTLTLLYNSYLYINLFSGVIFLEAISLHNLLQKSRIDTTLLNTSKKQIQEFRNSQNNQVDRNLLSSSDSTTSSSTQTTTTKSIFVTPNPVTVVPPKPEIVIRTTPGIDKVKVPVIPL